MNSHRASIFNCRQYQADIKEYVKQVDRGVYHRFQDYLIGLKGKFQQVIPALPTHESIVQEGMPPQIVQLWPLFDHDLYSLPGEEEIRRNNPTSCDIGWWFFVSLTEYLMPCVSPRNNWMVIKDALHLSGWSFKDSEALFKGHPTSELLKPTIGGVSPWPLKDTDPYWLWLHPSRGRSGWLDFEDLRYFHRKLINVKEKIMTFDLRRLPNIHSDNPIVVRDYTKYLQMGYRDTLQMVESGIQKEQGLFMTVVIS